MTLLPAVTAVTPGPVAVTTPARSLPWPEGNAAGQSSCIRPSRIFASPGLMPAALTCTSTCPGPGTGVGTSATSRTSTPPYSANRTAFIITAIITAPPAPDARTSSTAQPAGRARYAAGRYAVAVLCHRSGLRCTPGPGRGTLGPGQGRPGAAP